MKKIIYKILILVIGFTAILACEPMEDIYAELDKNPTPVVSDLNIVLEEDDYELSGNENAAKYGSFSNIDDAKEGIPNILTNNTKLSHFIF